MSVDVGSAKGYLDLDISGFLAGLKSAQQEADSTTKNMTTKIGSNMTSVGKSLTSAGTTLTKNVTVPLLAISTAGLKVATDFEKGMSEVKAISGATGSEFDALREKAIELGADTAFSAGEVAEAMTEMAKAGWDSKLIVNEMGGVLNAAAASGENLATVATIVADAMTGFGDETLTSARVADLLTQAANSGTIGINDLGESFKYIAPVAGSMGLSIEDCTTAISAMSMAGIKGSQAGTALRTMLTNLVKPTDQIAAAMDELGISATNSDGSMKSLDEIVDNLRNSFSGLTEAEKAKYAATLAGKEGMSGMLSLLNLTKEEYDEIAKSMDNAGGVAEETAAVMQDNLQSKVEQLGGALESLAIKMADHVIPYLRQFVEWLTNLIDKFTALDPETQKTILKFAGLAAAIGPTLVALGKVVTAGGKVFTSFGKLSSGFKAVSAGGKAGAGMLSKLGGALAGVTGPMIAVVAIIAVLAAAFVSLWKNNEDFRNKITNIWNQVKATFDKLCTGIVDRLNSLGFDFENIGEVLSAIWKGFCDLLAPYFEGVFQYIADTFDTIVNVILGVLDFFISLFKGDWEGCWNAIKSIFESIWNGIKNWFSNILNTLKGILNVVLGWFGTSWSKCWNDIKSYFQNIWNNITSWFKNTLNNIKKVFSDAWNSIKSTFQNIWNSISSAIKNALSNIKKTFSDTWNNVKSTFSNVWNSIKSTASSAINSVKSTISNGFNTAKSAVTSALDGMKSKISSVMESAKSIVTNAVAKLKSAFNFSWSLPKLKLPHISVYGGEAPYGIGGLGSLPSFSIEWYKKAMSGGMILNSPTIFGYNPITDKFLGAGEAGSETVVGTSSLMKMISSSVSNAIRPFIAATYQLARASTELGYVTYNGFVNQERMQNKFAEFVNNGGKGDTYNFYSPKAIDEIEAARQMKKTKRELAEGF